LEQERLTGIIRTWKPAKSYGFVFSAEANVDFLLHDSDIAAANRPRILVGERVEFTPTQSARGFQAFDATVVDAE
jgi:cold shock CspA family protein